MANMQQQLFWLYHFIPSILRKTQHATGKAKLRNSYILYVNFLSPTHHVKNKCLNYAKQSWGWCISLNIKARQSVWKRRMEIFRRRSEKSHAPCRWLWFPVEFLQIWATTLAAWKIMNMWTAAMSISNYKFKGGSFFFWNTLTCSKISRLDIILLTTLGGPERWAVTF